MSVCFHLLLGIYMALGPYSNCPCGSGKQFKWCCQPYYPLVEKAQRQHQKGQVIAAEASFAQLVREHPDVPQAFGYQAEFFLEQSRFAEADAALERGLSLDMNFARGHHLRGMLRREMGASDDALKCFRRAAECVSADATEMAGEICVRIGELELEMNRPAAARWALDSALALMPKQGELRKAVVSIFGPEGELPESARRIYGLRHAAGTAEAIAARDKLTERLKAAEVAAAARPSDPDAWFNVGLVRAWLGEHGGALEALYRSIDFDTNARTVEETGALAEILRFGAGLESEADYRAHRAVLDIRDMAAVQKQIGDWLDQRRFMILDHNEQSRLLSGLLLEPSIDLGVDAGPPLVAVMANAAIDSDRIMIWHTRADARDRALAEVRNALGSAVAEPHISTGGALFGAFLIEFTLIPTREVDDRARLHARVYERARDYFEETWLQRPLRSLNGQTPAAAVNEPSLRKRLPGMIKFLEDTAGPALVDLQAGEQSAAYSFDRLRHKLGLDLSAPMEGARLDVTLLNVSALTALQLEPLSDGQLSDAFRTALKLEAPDVAARFARAAAGRPGIADRFPFYNHLVRMAYEQQKPHEVIAILAEGELADRATNDGKRQDKYALARGQALARTGDVAGAATAFRDAFERAPNELRLYIAAAEAMLSRRQGSLALEFAEAGLTQARRMNNRDAEQQLLEIVAAAKKQSH